MARKSEKDEGGKKTPRFSNRRARHEFHILEVVECGLELLGTEVKSLRAGQARIDEAFARVRGGEAYLVGAEIAQYPQASAAMQHNPTRERRLLLHRRQIEQLAEHANQRGKTLVPLAMYFKKGWVKCEIGLAVGKKEFDKRQTLRERDQRREMDREMSRRRKG